MDIQSDYFMDIQSFLSAYYAKALIKINKLIKFKY